MCLGFESHPKKKRQPQLPPEHGRQTQLLSEGGVHCTAPSTGQGVHRLHSASSSLTVAAFCAISAGQFLNLISLRLCCELLILKHKSTTFLLQFFGGWLRMKARNHSAQLKNRNTDMFVLRRTETMISDHYRAAKLIEIKKFNCSTAVCSFSNRQ